MHTLNSWDELQNYRRMAALKEATMNAVNQEGCLVLTFNNPEDLNKAFSSLMRENFGLSMHGLTLKVFF